MPNQGIQYLESCFPREMLIELQADLCSEILDDELGGALASNGLSPGSRLIPGRAILA
jgi:hypothetical protein